MESISDFIPSNQFWRIYIIYSFLKSRGINTWSFTPKKLLFIMRENHLSPVDEILYLIFELLM